MAEQTRKKTRNYDAEAAYLLDQFYLRLRKWCLAKGNLAVCVPTWRDIQAVRVIVRMKTYSRADILQLMDKYIEHLDDLLSERPAQPSFTHFLDNARKII
ncbi:MAG: hypothetical protein QXT00_07995 [Ignisphaera sp.]